jgi:glycosyltransferase involved in cell wall biosynthesis
LTIHWLREDGLRNSLEISEPEKLVSDPLVSIVMLIYNHAPYLEEAFQGVVSQQTDFPFEILIGEDCSSDESLAIAAEFQKRNPDKVRLITSDSNVGMAQNARRLVRAARAEFLAYCEGDDYWTDSGKLQKQIEYLRSHPDHGAVHTDFGHSVYQFGRWVVSPSLHSRKAKAIPSGDTFRKLLCGNFVQTCTLCARTKLVKDVLASSLPIDTYPIGDWPQALYIAAHSKIGYIDQPTAVYRRTPGSIMNSGAQRNLHIARAYEPMLRDFFTHFDVGSADQLDALSSLHRTLLSLALLAGDRPAFKASWDWMREHDPAQTKPFRRRLMPWLMRIEVARKGLLMLLRTRAALLEAWLYRKPVDLFSGRKLGDSDQGRER